MVATSPPTEAPSAAFATALLTPSAGSDLSGGRLLAPSRRQLPPIFSQAMQQQHPQESALPANDVSLSLPRHVVASVVPGQPGTAEQAIEPAAASTSARPSSGTSASRVVGTPTQQQQQQQHGGAGRTVRVQASASPPQRQAASRNPAPARRGRGGGATRGAPMSGPVTPGTVSRASGDGGAATLFASPPGIVDVEAADGQWDVPGSRGEAHSLRAAPATEPPPARTRSAREALLLGVATPPRAMAVEAWGAPSPRAPVLQESPPA